MTTDNQIEMLVPAQLYYKCSKPDVCLCGCENGTVYYTKGEKPYNIFRCSLQTCNQI